MNYSRDFFSMDAHKKIHYDLHTAIRGSVYKQFAVSPNSSDRAETEHQCVLLGQYGIEAILTTTQKERYILRIHCQYFGRHEFYAGAWQCKTFW